MEDIKLWHGDCLELMQDIEAGSIDAIICDPPYGTTSCKWDSVIPFGAMWEQLNRVIKPNGAIVLFGSEPFSSALRMSNIKNYKYDWVWQKSKSGNPMLAKYQPLKKTESISIFEKSGLKVNYYPIPRKLAESVIKRNKARNKEKNKNIDNGNKSVHVNSKNIIHNFNFGLDYGYPYNLIKFNSQIRTQHPTQKPVLLMEYLIKTYTNEGETVLDFTMGSGTTLVACQNTKRKGIGIEQDDKYFNIAQERTTANRERLSQLLF